MVNYDIISLPPPSHFNVDSFKVRIPLTDETGKRQVDIYSPDIEARHITINENTGQVVKEYENNKSRHEVDGITTMYGIEVISQGLHWNKFLTVKVTAKHLRGAYFDGITIDNLKDVHNSIMNIGAFRYSFECFCGGLVTDIDYCRNLVIPHWSEVKSYLIENTKESKSGKTGYIETNEITNKGLQWSTREGATLKHPYIKIYNKTLQIKHDENMKKFASKFLDESPIDNLYRIEYTLKNLKHFRKYNLSNRLVDLLNVPYERREQIARDVIHHHVEGIFKQSKLYSSSLNKEYPASNRGEFLIYLLIKSYRQLNKPTSLILQEYAEFLNMRYVEGSEWNEADMNSKRQRLHRLRTEVGKVASRIPSDDIKTLLERDREEKERRKRAKQYRYENALVLKALGVVDDVEEWMYRPEGEESLQREIDDICDLENILNEAWSQTFPLSTDTLSYR